jgi:hypothetical protein
LKPQPEMHKLNILDSDSDDSTRRLAPRNTAAKKSITKVFGSSDESDDYNPNISKKVHPPPQVKKEINKKTPFMSDESSDDDYNYKKKGQRSGNS